VVASYRVEKGKELEEKYTKYAELAKSLGAVDALVIDARDIVFDPRTYLKCMYWLLVLGGSAGCVRRPWGR
jgi:hypothetical protein